MNNRVNSSQIKQWGSFSDRKDSFDDKDDLVCFIGESQENDKLDKFLKRQMTGVDWNDLVWKKHPFGVIDIDLAVWNKKTNEPEMVFDLERWSAWNPDWPAYYKHISFLERKSKYLNRFDVPFFMVYSNNVRTKFLMVEDIIIERYNPMTSTFRVKNVQDRIRKINLDKGRLFCDNDIISDLERKYFRCNKVELVYERKNN
jgi:hypothetical protein